jgi:sarcosine oxidase subunit gamma
MTETTLPAAPALHRPENPAELALTASYPSIRVMPQRSLAGVGLLGDDLQRLAEVLGEVPPLPGRQSSFQGMRWLWAGQRSWLAMTEADDPEFAPTLARRSAGIAAVTEQSDGRAILRIEGPAVREILTRVVPIDLHPASFPEDATALTLAAQINVQIWRDGENAFELACFRSFAMALFAGMERALGSLGSEQAMRGKRP